MRTLGLGLLAILTTTFALLSNGAPVAAEPTDKEKSEMAAKVYTLLKDKCESCHGEKAKQPGWKKTITHILDYDKLMAQKVIDLAKPEESKLYEEINEGEMPRELAEDGKSYVKKKLPQADIDLVLNWIKAGAPKWDDSGASTPVKDAREIRKFEGHSDVITSSVFSRDGKFVLTGSRDKTARLWNAATGKEVRKFEGHTTWVFAVAFTPDDKFVLTSSDCMRLFDVSTGKEQRKFADYVPSSTNYSADGKFVITGGADKTARLWDAATGAEILKLEGHADAVSSAVFSFDGKLIATGSLDNTARLWDAVAGKEIRQFVGHTKYVYSVDFSTDGNFVLTGSSDKTARLWNVATGEEVRKFEGHLDWVNSCALSPDGKYVLTGSMDKTAKLWDAGTGREVCNLKGHTHHVNSVAFSPDGKHVLTGSYDDTARLWAFDSAEK